MDTKDSNTNFTINWSILATAPAYSNKSKRCHLCLTEKLYLPLRLVYKPHLCISGTSNFKHDFGKKKKSKKHLVSEKKLVVCSQMSTINLTKSNEHCVFGAILFKFLKNALLFDWLKKTLQKAWAESHSRQHGNFLFRLSCAGIFNSYSSRKSRM